jgi:autoinducer 2 (AI-2) kinase
VPDRVLVIDAGTSAMRAVVVAQDGASSVAAVEPYRTFVPDDAAPFGREFNPRELQESLLRLIAAAGEGIAAIAFTGQREGIAFVDDRRQALFASPNVDARASAEGIATDAARGGEVYATTGHLPSLMLAPAKYAWLRQHRPEVAARVRHVLPLVDWLAMLVSGAPAMSRTLAAENGLLDITGGCVPLTLLDALGLPAPCVADVVADGPVAGAVREGTLAGRPVVLAGADTQCALLGMAVIEPGQAGVPAGWSAPLQAVTAAPVFDADRRTWTSVHAAPGRWILESNAGETGRAWEWMCSMLSVTRDEAERLTSSAPVGSRDAMSVLGPRAMRASEMTAGVGAITFPLPLVMSAPQRGDMLRSALEAAAFAIRANLEQIEAVSSTAVKRLALGGGMSRSDLFARIVADVIDRPVDVARTPETSALGAAMLAFTAIGTYSSIGAATRAMAPGGRTIAPRSAASAEYEDYYMRWCQLSDHMAEAN